MKLRASWALVALALPLVVAACGAQGGTGLTAADRTVYLAAIEPKGSTSVDKEPFPAAALPVGGGYGLEEPDADGKWTVETYRWLPGEITVVQGDKVTLEILGIHCFGGQAAEIIHIGQAIMAQVNGGNTLMYFINTTFNYPTMAEAYRVAALNGYNRLF